MTKQYVKAAFGLLVVLTLTACSHSHIGGVASGPNPLPPPGYRLACNSWPLIFNAYTSRCDPVVVPVEHRTVVRVRG